MSVNPYKQLPRDKGGEPMQEFATPFKAVAQSNWENIGASSYLSLSPNTTTIEITAVGTAAAIRWIATTDTQASVVTNAAGTPNFDNIIAVNTTRRFAVPIEAMYQAPSSMVGANIQNGLYRRVALKTATLSTPSSVLVSEF